MITEHLFADRNTLFATLAEDCAAILRGATAAGEMAALLVSGGSTPQPLYQRLSQLELPWSEVCVALVDERWVAPDHPASNEAFIRSNLLQQRAAAAQFVAMKTAAASAVAGLAGCEQTYQGLARPFALTILGMGPDGHVASLFPAAQGLPAALDADGDSLCAAITAHPSAVTGENTERMSLTFAGLLQSRQLHLLITGDEKLAVYRRALTNPEHMLMPASAILQQDKVPVQVYWAP